MAKDVRSAYEPGKSKAVAQKLGATETTACPFPKIPERKASIHGRTNDRTVTELSALGPPKFTAEVRFLEWTRGGYLRHAQVKSVAV